MGENAYDGGEAPALCRVRRAPGSLADHRAQTRPSNQTPMIIAFLTGGSDCTSRSPWVFTNDPSDCQHPTRQAGQLTSQPLRHSPQASTTPTSWECAPLLPCCMNTHAHTDAHSPCTAPQHSTSASIGLSIYAHTATPPTLLHCPHCYTGQYAPRFTLATPRPRPQIVEKPGKHVAPVARQLHQRAVREPCPWWLRVLALSLTTLRQLNKPGLRLLFLPLPEGMGSEVLISP